MHEKQRHEDTEAIRRYLRHCETIDHDKEEVSPELLQACMEATDRLHPRPDHPRWFQEADHAPEQGMDRYHAILAVMAIIASALYMNEVLRPVYDKLCP